MYFLLCEGCVRDDRSLDLLVYDIGSRSLACDSHDLRIIQYSTQREYERACDEIIDELEDSRLCPGCDSTFDEDDFFDHLTDTTAHGHLVFPNCYDYLLNITRHDRLAWISEYDWNAIQLRYAALFPNTRSIRTIWSPA